MVQSESIEILLAYFDWPVMKYHCMNVGSNLMFTLEKAVFRKWSIIVLSWKRPLTYFSLSKGINSSANHLSLFMLIYLPKHPLHWQSVAVCFFLGFRCYSYEWSREKSMCIFVVFEQQEGKNWSHLHKINVLLPSIWHCESNNLLLRQMPFLYSVKKIPVLQLTHHCDKIITYPKKD